MEGLLARAIEKLGEVAGGRCVSMMSAGYAPFSVAPYLSFAPRTFRASWSRRKWLQGARAHSQCSCAEGERGSASQALRLDSRTDRGPTPAFPRLRGVWTGMPLA